MKYLLYGLESNETRDYMETLLYTTKDSNMLEKAKAYAIKQGFHSFRVSSYNGEKPDFTNVLN